MNRDKLRANRSVLSRRARAGMGVVGQDSEVVQAVTRKFSRTAKDTASHGGTPNIPCVGHAFNETSPGKILHNRR
jgi:hypothetical protein